MLSRKLFCFTVSFLFINLSTSAQAWKDYNDSAKFYLEKKQTDKAIANFEKARHIIKKDSLQSDTHLLLIRNMAGLFFRESQFMKAAGLFEEAKEVSGNMYGKDIRYTSILNSLAAAYNSAGEYKLAEGNYLEARSLRLKLFGDQHPDYAQSTNNLGFYYWSIGDFNKAEPLILEAKAIREKILPVKQSRVYAISCAALANLYRDMGLTDKAEALYIEAKEIRAVVTPVRQTEDYATSCNILADLYNLTGNFTKAEPLYLEAKEIRSVNKQSSAYAESSNNLFALYSSMGEYGKAEPLALETKTIYETLLPPGDASLIIHTNNLGELYYKMGQFKKSETYFLQSREAWDKALGKDHPYYSSNTISMAKLYWSMGEIAKAKSFYEGASAASFDRINKIFQFTSEAEKDAYVKNINGTSDEYLSFFYKELNKEDATQPHLVSLRNRNLILSSTQQLRSIIYTSSDSNLHKKFDSWTAQKQKLGQIYVNPGGTTADEIKKLEEEANVLEKELSRTSDNFKTGQQKAIDWKLLQQSLKRGEAAIEFMDFKYNDGTRWTDSTFYVAIVLRRETRPKMIHLFEKKELETFIENTSTASEMYGHDRTDGEANNKNLFELIWKPLEKELNGIKKIYFAPAGTLHQIAFSALPISAVESLIDRYQLVQLNTTYSLTSSTTNQKVFNDRIKMYGGIVYDEDVDVTKQNIPTPFKTSHANLSFPTDNTRGKNWTYLPGTQKEISSIKRLAARKKIKVDSSEGITATEESIKILKGKSSPGVLHIATHGFFFPDPKEDKRSDFQKSFDKSGAAFKQSDNPLLRSGLLFAGANNTWQGKPLGRVEDGFLTAFEVAALYLPNTKLVVLSACETALGDVQGSEGVYGLQRSFKMAGVNHLLMSLWKVPDNETAEFMEEFYTHYFAGKDVNEAFGKSQIAMKNKYRNEPVKWAAWILVQ